jgi:hypothetical protein
VLELGPATTDRGAHRRHKSGRSRGGRGLRVGRRLRGKEENEAGFLKTRGDETSEKTQSV